MVSRFLDFSLSRFCLPVDLFDDLEGADTFAQSGRRFPAEADVVDESGGFSGPRTITGRKLPYRRFGRAHLRKHLVERQAFGTVAAAQAIYRDLPVTAINLQREQVLPLGAAHVEPGGLAGARPK